jgi:Pvc16 N-terminal domain/Carboxypeptidase regulatory-like domain
MIRDLSETLRALLDDPALAGRFPELAAAQVSFERPSETFNPSQTTLDLFLYDIRENVELRTNEPVVTRSNGQALLQRPPLRVACCYLVTAWPVGGAEPSLQEHRLLSQALLVLSGHATLPAKFLKGSLVGQEPPLPMLATHADGMKNPAEFWTALGNKLRPSITLVITISLEVFAQETAPLAATTVVRIGERVAGAHELSASTAQEFFHVGGRVLDAGGAPVAGAAVTLTGTAFQTESDADGYFRLGPLAKGSYTIRAQAGQSAKEVKIVVPAAAGRNYNVQF